MPVHQLFFHCQFLHKSRSHLHHLVTIPMLPINSVSVVAYRKTTLVHGFSPLPLHFILTFHCLTFSSEHLDSSHILLQLHFEHLIFSVDKKGRINTYCCFLKIEESPLQWKHTICNNKIYLSCVIKMKKNNDLHIK